MERLSDQVCEKVADALTRMLAFGELVESIEFSLTVVPTPNGLIPVGVVYVALKGPLVGSVLQNTDVVLDLSVLASQQGIDQSVRQSLDSIRAQKAAILAGVNGHLGG